MTDPRIEAGDAFIRRVTAAFAAMAIGYGILTFIFGPRLWGPPAAPGGLYSTAMTVPGAPQTWGAVAIVAGVLILVGQYRRRYLMLQWGCRVWSTWLFFFAITFTIDAFNGVATANPPAWVYFCLAVVMVIRGELAREWRHDE